MSPLGTVILGFSIIFLFFLLVVAFYLPVVVISSSFESSNYMGVMRMMKRDRMMMLGLKGSSVGL